MEQTILAYNLWAVIATSLWALSCYFVYLAVLGVVKTFKVIDDYKKPMGFDEWRYKTFPDDFYYSPTEWRKMYQDYLNRK
jgi:hypothetical protein